MSGCIFCSRTPQTKTHVFRKAWIDRLMVPAPGPSRMAHETADMSGARRENDWPADEFDMAPGAACDPCNSGWMDKVDRAAERVVEPMVIGRKATIRRYDDQKAVARWITQVAILIDQTQIKQVVPDDFAKRFYADREPAAGMIAWLAGTRTEWIVEAWERSWILSTGPDSVPPDRPNMCLFTFRIVNLVVQAVIPLDDEARCAFVFDRGENMKFVKQLWPSRFTPVSWPPQAIISPDTLWRFSRSFEPSLEIKPGEWAS